MNNKRPVLKLNYSWLDKIITSVAFIALAASFLLVFMNLGNLPSKVPTHADATGNVNGWGSKYVLIILPIINIIMFLSLIALSKFPHIYNYPVEITEENAEYQYRNARSLMINLNALCTVMFAYICWQSVQLAKYGKDSGIIFVFLFILIMFIAIAYYAVKAMKN
ncbi:DUF1648 domain-containing protein [Clostridium sp. 19966]|uniref:DUF1648 domain-containing protein n=1 Tax=Clostridium sp. 19966 TaxID=2768166 RepID=UPI0028DF0029|nr:DUF1648 domain-containing protein [Clostridium sp. 19966]MDT8717646.1 DUF1648 domain-containing protein [Clostridium sp. 19966]